MSTIPQEYAQTTRRTFPDHPYVAAVTALRERLPGEKRDKVPTPYLSSSQIKALRRCGAAYYFQYRLGHKETTRSKMFFGSCVHIGAEVFFRLVRGARADGVAPNYAAITQEAIRIAQLYARQRLPKPILWDPTYSRSPDMETFDSLTLGVGKAVARLAEASWTTLVPIAIERGYYIEWKDPRVLPVLGYPDLVHERNGEHAVMDNKTGAEKKDFSTELDIGLAFYALGHELFSGIRTRQVSYANYVRNKEPKVVIPSKIITEEHFERAYLRAQLATETIAEGLYAPADDDMTCKPCQFRANCLKWLTIDGESKIEKATWPDPSVEPETPLLTLVDGGITTIVPQSASLGA